MMLLWIGLLTAGILVCIHFRSGAKYSAVVGHVESCLTAYVHTMGRYDLSKVNKTALLRDLDRLAQKRHYATDGVKRAFEEVRCVPPMYGLVVREWVDCCDANSTFTLEEFQHAVESLTGLYMASGFTHDFAALKAAVSIYHGYWEDAE